MFYVVPRRVFVEEDVDGDEQIEREKHAEGDQLDVSVNEEYSDGLQEREV